MSEPTTGSGKRHVMQLVLDDNMLMLFLAITVPTVFYTLWGIMEVITIPMAK